MVRKGWGGVVAVALTATLFASSFAEASPRRKPIRRSYTAIAPAPGPPPTCTVEDVNVDIEPFTAPDIGRLTVWIDPLIGDWDLWIEDDATGKELDGSYGGMGVQEIVQVFLSKGQDVGIFACNSGGGEPQVTVNLIYEFGPPRSFRSYPKLGPENMDDVFKDEYTATAIPFPGPYDTFEMGCIAGIEGMHKKTYGFEAPGDGLLTATLDGYYGDWDLFLTDRDGRVLYESSTGWGSLPQSEEIFYVLEGGENVEVVACNWAGGPNAVGKIRFTY